MASWGSLAHITVAGPGALLSFLGPRVYEAINGTPFPKNVQVAEHLFDKGLIDSVVPPSQLSDVVDRALSILVTGPTPHAPRAWRSVQSGLPQVPDAPRRLSGSPPYRRPRAKPPVFGSDMAFTPQPDVSDSILTALKHPLKWPPNIWPVIGVPRWAGVHSGNARSGRAKRSDSRPASHSDEGEELSLNEFSCHSEWNLVREGDGVSSRFVAGNQDSAPTN
ncbi:hypothetical protein J2X42_002499 [Arthrobacter sp. BE255]|nr:hypothetical protein [Arthrobacter sp. BE255]